MQAKSIYSKNIHAFKGKKRGAKMDLVVLKNRVFKIFRVEQQEQRWLCRSKKIMIIIYNSKILCEIAKNMTP